VGQQKNTDAPDILHIANSYDMVLGDKIWEDEAMTIMADYDYDQSLTAARLLGKQARAIADDVTRITLATLLKEDEAFEKFVIAATRTAGVEWTPAASKRTRGVSKHFG
jgi:predicted nucleotidyltransferase